MEVAVEKLSRFIIQLEIPSVRTPAIVLASVKQGRNLQPELKHMRQQRRPEPKIEFRQK